MEKKENNNPLTFATQESAFSNNSSKELNMIIKSDVHGSSEAIKNAISQIKHDEVKAKIILADIGMVTETDVTLAKASNAVLIAFNVKPSKEAKKRGNSVYLPGRVLPMLPEKLSNDLCSLKPNEKRACLAVEIHLDARGNKTKHRFTRGVIKSIARLTYDNVQSVYEGLSDERQLNLPAGILDHLFAVYKCRKKLRKKQGRR